jgi:hypothetical protein
VKVVKFQGEFVWQTMLGRTSSSWSCEAASE